LLHLSEGVTKPAKPLSTARKHFLALEVARGQWALDDTFAGIHASGLLAKDFDVLARHGTHPKVYRVHIVKRGLAAALIQEEAGTSLRTLTGW
jgi:hypothetical protein